MLPGCAAALAGGAINLGHIEVIRDVLRKAQRYTSAPQRAALEQRLVGLAAANPPETVKAAGGELLYLLNQDGPGPDYPVHQPGLRLGPQDADGNYRVSGHLDAETAAYWKTIESGWAAQGVNNPDDP